MITVHAAPEEDDQWILWGKIVNEWDDFKRKKEKQLKVNAMLCVISHLTYLTLKIFSASDTV